MKRGDLTPAERESVILSNDEDNFYTISTIQQKMMTKLNKITEPYRIEKDEDGKIFCAFYKIPWKQVSFRKPSKPSTIKRTPNPNAFGRGKKKELETETKDEE